MTVPDLGALSERGREAWKLSFLGRISPPASEVLLQAAFEFEVDPGQIVHREARRPPTPVLMLVTYGLLRVFISSPHGREVTVRHVRRGQVTGLPGVVAEGTPHGVQAVTRCGLVSLPARIMHRLIRSDLTVASIVCEELTAITFDVTDHLAARVFGTINERVAAALLELAREEGDRLVVRANQQHIADAIGSVREVVARALRHLRDEGVIDRLETQIILTDPDALRRIADQGAFDWRAGS